MMEPIRVTLSEMARAFAYLAAGVKLAFILGTAIGVGSFAKWVIEQWYPFTRWLWDNILLYLDLPKLNQIEKDSLTALVFFLPLGISSLISSSKTPDDQNSVTIQFISGALGAIFFIILCWDVVMFAFNSTTPTIISGLEWYHKETMDMFIFFFNNSILGIGALMIYVISVAVVFATLRRVYRGERWHKLIRTVNRYSAALFAIVFLLASITASVISDSFLPVLSVVLIVCIVAISIIRSPRLLLTASGAALGFILLAVVYEVCLLAIRFIESVNKTGIVS